MAATRKKTIREIAISEFKAKCLSLLEHVSETKTPLRVTRRGKAIVDVVPVGTDDKDRSWFGSMAGTMEILGEIVHGAVLPPPGGAKLGLAGQAGLRRLRGKIRWDGDLDKSRLGHS